jgi:hypothetical protein
MQFDEVAVTSPPVRAAAMRALQCIMQQQPAALQQAAGPTGAAVATLACAAVAGLLLFGNASMQSLVTADTLA